MSSRRPVPKGRGRARPVPSFGGRKGASAAPPRPRPRPIPGQRTSAEIVSIGREILHGRTIDTNAPEIAAYLSQCGAVVRRITIVDDREQAIAPAVADALSRGCRLVVTSGGLGPMADDRTLRGVADALHVPLAIHAGAKEMVEASYRRLRAMRLVSTDGLTATREKMCSIPIGAEPIPNALGIAPGILFRMAGGAAVLCLPGVPAEMRCVLEAAIGHLRELLPRGALARREIETPTADESALKPLLDRLAKEFPSVWIKSQPRGFDAADAKVLVILEAIAPERSQAESLVDDAVRRLIALAAGGLPPAPR